jgi:hypothetical protein
MQAASKFHFGASFVDFSPITRHMVQQIHTAIAIRSVWNKSISTNFPEGLVKRVVDNSLKATTTATKQADQAFFTSKLSHITKSGTAPAFGTLS